MEGGVKGSDVMVRVRLRSWGMLCVWERPYRGRSVSALVSSEADVAPID